MKKFMNNKKVMLNLFQHLRVTALALSALIFAGCSDMFQDRVPMALYTNGATLAKMFEPEEEIENLDAPKQVFVTNGEYSDRIIVSWEKVRGARSYKLERAIATEKIKVGNSWKWKVPDEGEFTTLPHSTFIEGTSFTDVIIDNTPANVLDYNNEAYNCGYFYRVSAENNIEKYGESEWFPNYYKEAEEGKPAPAPDPEAVGALLTPPSGLKATCGKYQEKIVLSWASAAGSVSSYRIYRSINSDGSGGSQIATVYGNTASYPISVAADQKGVNYYFTIVSVGSSGNESVSSSVALGYALKPGAPTAVENVCVTKGRGDSSSVVTIQWDENGADKYRLFRYTSADATLRQFTKDIDKSGTGTGTLSTDDPLTLAPNVFYYYRVQAISKIGEEEYFGALSDSGDDSETQDPAEAFLLSPPQSVAVKKLQNDINNNSIVFSAAIGDQNSEYNSPATIKMAESGSFTWNSYTYVVYGSNTADSASFIQIKEFDSPTKSEEEKGCYEEKVPVYKFYKVSVKNGSEESEKSAAIAPAPYAAQNLSVTKNGSIPGYTNDDKNANANGVHALTLTWEAPTGGADGGYNIYRSAKANSGFKKINESPITETSYTYLDEQAKAGNYYYYKVLSLNSLGQGANYSNVDHGYGALTAFQYVREYIKTTLASQKKLTLMHKSGNTAKLGQETAQGTISGSLSYDAHVSGMSGRVIMQYTNYADFYIMNDKTLGPSFVLNGNTNTSAGMDTNGTMDGTVNVTGMYEGSVGYDGVQIKGGKAGGGFYAVTRKLKKSDGSIESLSVNGDWTWGEK